MAAFILPSACCLLLPPCLRSLSTPAPEQVSLAPGSKAPRTWPALGVYGPVPEEPGAELYGKQQRGNH